MGNDLSIWALVLDASPIVQGVMLLLMAASVASWAVIFKKSRVISHSRRQADHFETAFWSGRRSGHALPQHRDQGTGGHRRTKHFRVRFRRVQPPAPAGHPVGSIAGGCTPRHARGADAGNGPPRTQSRHARHGGVPPVPTWELFGTVWGIMSAFHNLGNVQQATLAAVAPGIAEALIATAIGLFAAIPRGGGVPTASPTR